MNLEVFQIGKHTSEEPFLDPRHPLFGPATAPTAAPGRQTSHTPVFDAAIVSISTGAPFDQGNIYRCSWLYHSWTKKNPCPKTFTQVLSPSPPNQGKDQRVTIHPTAMIGHCCKLSPLFEWIRHTISLKVCLQRNGQSKLPFAQVAWKKHTYFQ